MTSTANVEAVKVLLEQAAMLIDGWTVATNSRHLQGWGVHTNAVVDMLSKRDAEMASAIRALLPPSTGSGEGTDYVLVPREPTQEMVSAAHREQPDATNAGFSKAYRDMLAAAPPTTPPSSGEDAGVTIAPVADVGVVATDSTDYVKLVVEPKHGARQEYRISIGAADVLFHELAGMSGYPTPVPEGREALREALEDSQSLLVAMLHEARPATEIEAQIVANRAALSPVSGSAAEAWQPIETAPLNKIIDVYAWNIVESGPEESLGRSSA